MIAEVGIRAILGQPTRQRVSMIVIFAQAETRTTKGIEASDAGKTDQKRLMTRSPSKLARIEDSESQKVEASKKRRGLGNWDLMR